MKKIILFTIAFTLVSAFSPLNLSIKSYAALPTNYETLLENPEVKKITYSCIFDNQKYAYPTCSFVEKCDGKSTCFKVNDLDYVSFFISYNFQSNKLIASDYIMNLARSFEKDKQVIQKEYISELFNPEKRSFYDEDKKNLLFQKMMFAHMEPSSFVTKAGNDISIFLSKKDIFLRSVIYPSLKLNGLTYDERQPLEYLTETSLKYAVYPQTIEVGYVTEWMAEYVGAPSLKKYEDDFQVVLSYFNTLSKNKDKIEDHSVSKLLESEKARPFVFENKITNIVKANKDDKLVLPRLLGEDNHYLNEFLPRYVLEKIEIIEKKNKTEKVIKTYNKNNIAELLISNEEIAGFAYRVDNVKDSSLTVRYTHVAEQPRYSNPGYLKLRNSGLHKIYNKLRKVIVTDLDIKSPYEITSLPYDCIEQVKVSEILSKQGVSKQEIDTYLSLFKNKNTKCIDSELFMTKVIFLRDFRE